MEKNTKKVKILSKHGVENGVTMETCDTIDAIFFSESCSLINFSKSSHIWLVLV